uniref:Peptidase S8/S53 domain-containing protein n=1 Tax=Oryza rufipogon TaxID=4529 RepID=A0A0E0P4P4_ORYRU
MSKLSRQSLFLTFLLQFLLQLPWSSHALKQGEPPTKRRHDDADLVTDSHHDMLASVLGSKEAALESIVYSYRYSFSGFAARLTKAQASIIRGLPDVVSVRENHIHQLHTSRSWDFLGMDYRQPNGLLAKANYGEDIIIGVLDTGITPESPSFADDGYGPPPSKWKGICQVGPSFEAKSCNRKLIGARWYIDDDTLSSMSKNEILSPRDVEGHGTHTASTAGGNIVHNASILGLATGTVRGGAPRARVAMYKICWSGSGCSAAVQLKALDDAVYDGVDVLSLSLGSPLEDLGTLHVVAKGIPVVYSAGNDGPVAQTVENSSPWLLTVAAATMDRSFPVVITLGDNHKFVAQSFVLSRQTTSQFSEIQVFERDDTVKGKTVFCFGTKLDPEPDINSIIKVTGEKGGTGVIMPKYNTDTLLQDGPLTLPIPFVVVDYEIAYRIYQYYTNENDGTAKVKISLTQTTIGKVTAPKVAAFSSRGPSIPYHFESGTSMACPHVSGIVAILKSLHPEWSPAALKSAIMTTALTYDNDGMPIQANGRVQKIADPFDYGAGFINPNMAADPGLIYDISASDYLKFFNCMGGLGSGDNCTTVKGSLADLNLPSISIPNLKTIQVATRTVTNVGQANAVYKAFLQPPVGIEMAVEPPMLVFSKDRKVQSFKVTFKVTRRPIQGDYRFGSLAWHDGGNHWVRIPIAVRIIADRFNYGAGFVNPNMAADPGLIYDIEPSDYFKFFNCMGGLGSRDNCTTVKESIADLNLPFSKLQALFLVLLFQLNLQLQWSYGLQTDQSRLYIVYLGERQHEDADLVTASHHDMLTSILGSKEETLRSIVYSYRHGFSGFSAMLTQSQARKIAGLPGVLSVTENQIYKTHTTRSWDFLGLDYKPTNGLLAKARYGEGVIIGVVDTGITPESPSFDDAGYGTPPSKWKGICQVGPSFGTNSCNRKIIGARWYAYDVPNGTLDTEVLSPRDVHGHGTHTASTAGGNIVHNVSRLGLAAGTAHGGAPRARLAIYKACWATPDGTGCSGAGLLKAMDDAIHDGVDILSLSIGGPFEHMGTLHVVANGIAVVYSAGNDGPIAQTVENSSPWLLTVAAATMDRSFPVVITLGNNEKFVAQSFVVTGSASQFSEIQMYDNDNCNADNIDNTVKGMIVFCFITKFDMENYDRIINTVASKVASKGGRGVIFPKYSTDLFLREDLITFDIPFVLVDYEISYRIRQYIINNENGNIPKAKISLTKTMVGSENSAPKIAAFSSRGPSYIYPGVLKPDIAAPGVAILAASPNTPEFKGVPYRFDSGTSMACPHVSGIIAVLKSLHPEWSPAALKSAIMTTVHIVIEEIYSNIS